jgi:hypothetical protein
LRAVTLQNVEAVRLLVDCPIVNMNIQDTESGYTALHRVREIRDSNDPVGTVFGILGHCLGDSEAKRL